MKKQSPNNQIFYGLPVTKTIPKNKEDLINKFKYVTNIYMNSIIDYPYMIFLYIDH